MKKTTSREEMKRLCNVISEQLPKDQGFIIFTFPFGELGVEDLEIRYASNANRKDVVAAIKTWLIKRGFDEDWMREHD